MQNIRELRQSLAENYDLIKANIMPVKTGKELNNAAGKIINSLKVELEYNQFMENRRKIDFLEF
jgi:hypothetical protein